MLQSVRLLLTHFRVYKLLPERIVRGLVLILCVVIFNAGFIVTVHAAPADHLILVSIDGLRPEFYLDERWPAPTLQRLAREGSVAKGVRPGFPSVTYPNHTTMVTGAWPARHGVYYNSPFAAAGDRGHWYWQAAAIQVPALWDALPAADVSVAVGWPVSVGAAIDYNLPEYWTPGRFDNFVQPLREVARPRGLLEQVEREATGAWSDARIANDHPRRDLLTANAVAWLFKEKHPRLTLWHAIAVDHFQHAEGRDGDGVREALAAVDSGLGLILDHAGKAGLLDRTAIIVTGDHGFFDIHTRLAPNVLLRQAGLLDDHRRRSQWRAAFHTAGASAFLHLKDAGDAQTVARVRETLNNLPTAERALFRIMERDELARWHSAPEAALALAPVPGVTFTGDSQGEWRRPATGGQHGFLPERPEMFTGLVVWGAGVQPGVVVEHVNLTDVAPLAAALLALAFDAPDGLVPVGLLAAGQ